MSRKIALVTGGASGIGKAVVERLLASGAHVYAVDSNAALLKDLKQAHASAPLDIIPADVSDPEAATAAVTACVEAHGRVDYLVNAAGIVHPAVPLHELEHADFDRIQAVNLFGSFAFHRAAVQQMLTQRSGAIVNIASTAGIRPVPNAGGYTASKHAVVGMTMTAALELAASGIRVNVVCPGVIDTPLFRANLNGGPAESMSQMIPSRRLGRPEEIADAVAWLLSDQASYVTGVVLPVDGGVSLI